MRKKKTRNRVGGTYGLRLHTHTKPTITFYIFQYLEANKKTCMEAGEETKVEWHLRRLLLVDKLLGLCGYLLLDPHKTISYHVRAIGKWLKVKTHSV